MRSDFSPYDNIFIQMDEFINVIKKDPQVRIKIEDKLDE